MGKSEAAVCTLDELAAHDQWMEHLGQTLERILGLVGWVQRAVVELVFVDQAAEVLSQPVALAFRYCQRSPVRYPEMVDQKVHLFQLRLWGSRVSVPEEVVLAVGKLRARLLRDPDLVQTAKVLPSVEAADCFRKASDDAVLVAISAERDRTTATIRLRPCQHSGRRIGPYAQVGGGEAARLSLGNVRACALFPRNDAEIPDRIRGGQRFSIRQSKTVADRATCGPDAPGGGAAPGAMTAGNPSAGQRIRTAGAVPAGP